MFEETLRQLLTDVRSGAVSPDEAVAQLRRLPFAEVGDALVDHHRALLGQIPETEGIQGGDVGGQHPGLVFQVAVEHDIAVGGAEGLALGVIEGLVADRRQGPEISLRRPLVIHLVVKLLGRFASGVAVFELIAGRGSNGGRSAINCGLFFAAGNGGHACKKYCRNKPLICLHNFH